MGLFDMFKKKSPLLIDSAAKGLAEQSPRPQTDTPAKIMEDFAAEVLTWPREQAVRGTLISKGFVQGDMGVFDKLKDGLTVRQYMFVLEHCNRIQAEVMSRTPPSDTEDDDT